jgi:hypothetical protein
MTIGQIDQGKGKASFCEQKEAKRLCLLWAVGVVGATDSAQHRKSFCAAFFKKRPLS